MSFNLQPPSRASLRRQIAATDDYRNGDLLQPISPASCSSSSSSLQVKKTKFFALCSLLNLTKECFLTILF
jgi:hypothetical protein